MNPVRIKNAAERAWKAHLRYKNIMPERNLTRVEAIGLMQGSEPAEGEDRKGMTIGLAGHPYVLHDEQISHSLIKRLLAYGIKVVTPEMVPEMSFRYQSGTPVAGLCKRYWESEEDMLDPWSITHRPAWTA
jgi:predicted nucleotide-binding protein (sugar kinase/HSP70/actin superfamily)